MLTKQARAEIAKRAKKFSLLDIESVYKIFFGKKPPMSTTYQEDSEAVIPLLVDLCDTSDMLELPIDKNSVPIHIGDTVWCNGEKETVKAIEIRDSETRIHFVVPLGCESWSSPELITHAEPISDHESIARAIEDITHCLNDAAASLKLQDIAMELRKLGDGNE